MIYDSGQVMVLPYCASATQHFLVAHGTVGAPFDDNVIEVRITRRGGVN